MTGLVGGISTLTRSPLLLGVFLALPPLAWARPRVPGRRTALLIIFVVTMGVTGLATLRNWVVAHEFVLVNSEGPVTLFLGNEPPKWVKPPPPVRKILYDALRLDPYVRSVAEYARQAPATFVWGLVRKAKYTLGWFNAVFPDRGRSDLYVALWVLALLGLPGIMRSRVSPWIAGVPLILALTQFAVVVIFWPYAYGDRLILPFYALILPYAAIPIAWVAQRVIRGPQAERIAVLALAGAILLAVVTPAARLAESAIHERRSDGAMSAQTLDGLVKNGRMLELQRYCGARLAAGQPLGSPRDHVAARQGRTTRRRTNDFDPAAGDRERAKPLRSSRGGRFGERSGERSVALDAGRYIRCAAGPGPDTIRQVHRCFQRSDRGRLQCGGAVRTDCCAHRPTPVAP